MVEDINPSGDSSPDFLAAVGSTLYFGRMMACTGKNCGRAMGLPPGQPYSETLTRAQPLLSSKHNQSGQSSLLCGERRGQRH